MKKFTLDFLVKCSFQKDWIIVQGRKHWSVFERVNKLSHLREKGPLSHRSSGQKFGVISEPCGSVPLSANKTDAVRSELKSKMSSLALFCSFDLSNHYLRRAARYG